ncbi:hypothetical protein ACIP6P_30270 [Streptomyces sp. NPDC088729]|uniref:hypothetical protein n=1 Tax=Streptomyces sp. NPDC088729 TaxID=3365876 RepID=UPI0037F7754A
MNSSVHVWRRGLAATAAVLLLGTGAVACGGDDKPAAKESTSVNTGAGAGDDGSRDTGASGGGSEDTGTGGGSADGEGVAYAACMRANGVDVPDPAAGESPRLPKDVAQALLDKAEKECGDTPGSRMAGSGGLSGDPRLEALSLANQKCLRENGYEMPESKGEMQPSRPGENPVLDRAQKACKAAGDALSDYLDQKLGTK